VADKTPLTSDTYTVPGIRGKAELHDWQQPQEPISHWVGRLTRPGDVVADPFVGSGTVAVACREHGRKFVGTEIDKKAFRVARGRLAGEVPVPANNEKAVTDRPSSSPPDTAAPGHRPKRRVGKRRASPAGRGR